jgi:hypothetical protein
VAGRTGTVGQPISPRRQLHHHSSSNSGGGGRGGGGGGGGGEGGGGGGGEGSASALEIAPPVTSPHGSSKVASPADGRQGADTVHAMEEGGGGALWHEPALHREPLPARQRAPMSAAMSHAPSSVGMKRAGSQPAIERAAVPAVTAAGAPGAEATESESLLPGSLQRLRAAHHSVAAAEGHISRLASLLREAHAALGLLLPPARQQGDGGHELLRGDSATSVGVGSGEQAPRVSDLERQLVVTMSEVLADVEGELRTVSGRLQAAHGEMADALGAQGLEAAASKRGGPGA